MLVKVGSDSTLNVTRIISSFIETKDEKVVVKKGRWFEEDQVEVQRTFGVEINYYDIDGKQSRFTLMCETLEVARKVHKEFLGQVKELELEDMTETLESAIRNS